MRESAREVKQGQTKTCDVALREFHFAKRSLPALHFVMQIGQTQFS